MLYSEELSPQVPSIPDVDKGKGNLFLLFPDRIFQGKMLDLLTTHKSVRLTEEANASGI